MYIWVILTLNLKKFIIKNIYKKVIKLRSIPSLVNLKFY